MAQPHIAAGQSETNDDEHQYRCVKHDPSDLALEVCRRMNS
jgi:hypothetical protein